MSALAQLRAHVEQWRGLNHADATMLLDLLEAKGARIEYGFPIDADTDPNDVTSDRIEFINVELAHDNTWADPIWTRVVGRWEQIR